MTDRKTRALWALFVLIGAVSTVLLLRRPLNDRLSDLHIYHGAIRHLQAGQPLYEYVAENGGPFTYPPFAALVLWPIGYVPEGLLQAVWLVLTCAAVVALAAALGGTLRPTAHRRPMVVAAAACALMLSAPVQSNLRFGQVSIFIVLLALVDGMGLTPARWRGVLVGIAAAIKLTPLLFVAYFLVSGRCRDAARAGATFVGCAAIGALVLPSDSVTYWTGTVAQTSRIGNLASLGNQSVHGMLLRAGVDPGDLPVIWAALVAVIGVVALLRARRISLDGRPVHAAVLVGCATVAISPVSWTHHQIWPVLAAMLLIAVPPAWQRAAGIALLATMVLSLGPLLSPVTMRPGVQFLFENARALAAVAVCLAGFGGLAVVARQRASTGAGAGSRRGWLRLGAATAAVVAFFAVQPLPAGADPTFKAYAMADAHNPRYFFVCDGPAECSEFLGDQLINFAVTREKTKVRVNGVVGPAVARLAYYSAPGGAARDIPLLQVHAGPRVFSFRSANLAHGQLVAYAADGSTLAAFRDELDPSEAD